MPCRSITAAAVSTILPMLQVLLIKVVEQVSILVARTSSSLNHIVGIEIILHPKRKTQRKDYGRLLLLRTQNWASSSSYPKSGFSEYKTKTGLLLLRTLNWAFLSTKPKPGFYFFFVPQIGLFLSTQTKPSSYPKLGFFLLHNQNWAFSGYSTKTGLLLLSAPN
jgi:hypothetical protein